MFKTLHLLYNTSSIIRHGKFLYCSNWSHKGITFLHIFYLQDPLLENPFKFYILCLPDTHYCIYYKFILPIKFTLVTIWISEQCHIISMTTVEHITPEQLHRSMTFPSTPGGSTVQYLMDTSLVEVAWPLGTMISTQSLLTLMLRLTWILSTFQSNSNVTRIGHNLFIVIVGSIRHKVKYIYSFCRIYMAYLNMLIVVVGSTWHI